jgi:hypothetical protein
MAAECDPEDLPGSDQKFIPKSTRRCVLPPKLQGQEEERRDGDDPRDRRNKVIVKLTFRDRVRREEGAEIGLKASRCEQDDKYQYR